METYTNKVEHFKITFDKIYLSYNHRCLVHPDPLEFLYNYDNLQDREFVGIISSVLAYGRVKQILLSIRRILEKIDSSPAKFFSEISLKELENKLIFFKHRFTTGKELASLLKGISKIIEDYGSLGNCFHKGLQDKHETVIDALGIFSDRIRFASGEQLPFLLPSVLRGSACKRLNLFLRWMVRKDEVDPGGWDRVSPSKLIIPLDTHIYSIAKALGFTKRKSADMKTALEITEAFKDISNQDPIKYDFALSRFGIRNDMDKKDILELLRVQ